MISVVIPTYNREKVLARAIDSVLNQTYGDLEVIVADDCSTDNTRRLVERYSDPRVRYGCLEKNSGACAARNLGIEMARGEYIAFQDSDDQWHADKLQVQMEEMEKTGADLTFCSFEKRFDNGTCLVHPKGLQSHFCDREELLYQSLASTQCILGKADAVRATMFDVTMPRLQDYDFIIRASEKYRIYYTDAVLVTLYEQADAITAGKRGYRKHMEIAQKLLEKYDDLRVAYPKWELKMLKTIAHSQVMQKMDAVPVLRQIYEKEKTMGNLAKILLCKMGLLYHIWDKTDR